MCALCAVAASFFKLFELLYLSTAIYKTNNFKSI